MHVLGGKRVWMGSRALDRSSELRLVAQVRLDFGLPGSGSRKETTPPRANMEIIKRRLAGHWRLVTATKKKKDKKANHVRETRGAETALVGCH